MAYDAQTPHFYFSSSLKSSNPLIEDLFTTVLGNTPAPLPIKLDNNCPLLTKGVAAWVTPDGKWLLFGGQLPDANNKCMNDDLKGRFRLYYTQLDTETGQQMAGAVAQEIIPASTQSYVFPSLSPDRCVLYFSELISSGGTTTSESYTAIRE